MSNCDTLHCNPHCLCNQCDQAFAADMTLRKHKKIFFQTVCDNGKAGKGKEAAMNTWMHYHGWKHGPTTLKFQLAFDSTLPVYWIVTICSCFLLIVTVH